MATGIQKSNARFHIVTHCYATLFLRKKYFKGNKHHFLQPRDANMKQKQQLILKVYQKKYEVPFDSFANFANVSSYLHLKDFAWKRN